MSADEFDPQTWPVNEVLVLPESDGVQPAVYLGVIGGPKAYVRLAFVDGRPVLDGRTDWCWYPHPSAVSVYAAE